MLARVAARQLDVVPAIEVRRQLLEDAIAFYTDLLQLNPRDAQAYLERGHVKRMLFGRYDLAPLADYEKAIELVPNRADYYDYAIRALTAKPGRPRQDYERALALAQRALKLEPDNGLYRCWLAVSYARLGMPDQARAELQRVETGGPHTAETYSILGYAYGSALGDPAKALPYSRKSVEMSPSNVRYRLRLRMDLNGLGRVDEALAVASQIFEKGIDPKDVVALFDYDYQGFLASDRGDKYLREKRYAEALQEFDKVVELDPSSPYHVHKHRATAHFRLKHYPEALAALTKAVDLRPDDFSSLIWISPKEIAKCPDARLRDGLLALAEKAIQAKKGAAGAYTASAILHSEFGPPEKAAAQFKTALELLRKESAANQDYGPWYFSALYCLKKGDLPGYRQTCADMLKRFAASKNQNDRRFTVWTCALGPQAVEEYATAVELARRFAGSSPKNRVSLEYLGAILYRSGHFAEALAQLTAALNAPEDKHTTVTYSHFFLAMTHHRLGHHDEARRWFNQAAQATKKMLAEDKTEGGEPVPWNRRLTLEVLHAEAQALLGEVELLPPPQAVKERNGSASGGR
jgi:tetratricopeptide (TPR) repeat protein